MLVDPPYRITISDIKVVELSNPSQPGGGGGWWAAKCKRCGGWVSKYDYSRADCLRLALGARHECRPR